MQSLSSSNLYSYSYKYLHFKFPCYPREDESRKMTKFSSNTVIVAQGEGVFKAQYE